MITLTAPRLRLSGLTVRYETESGPHRGVTGIDLSVDPGPTVGLIGQGGAGKTTLATTLVDALPPAGNVIRGAIWFRAPHLAHRHAPDRPPNVDTDLVDLCRLPARVRTRINRSRLRLIPATFPPAPPADGDVGHYLEELLAIDRPAAARPSWLHTPDASLRDRVQGAITGRSPADRRRGAVAAELLSRLGVGDPERVLAARSTEVSTEIRHRVAIAAALAPGPEVLIADEPTTRFTDPEAAALGELLADWQEATGMAILLLSTKPAFLREHCDRIGVLYDGRLVDFGRPESVFEAPVHPSLGRLL